jgi:hypothetical protein
LAVVEGRKLKRSEVHDVQQKFHENLSVVSNVIREQVTWKYGPA